MASFFPVLMVARWMGVAPWELARQPTFWLHAGTSTIAALQAKDGES